MGEETINHALRSASGEGVTRENAQPPCNLEVCEITGERLFRAGEYAAPGDYVEIQTGRRVTLVSPDFLPACLNGRVACYRLAKHGIGDTREQAFAQRQAHFQRLAARVHPRLYSFARRAVGNAQDAEDVAQETLARAWTHFESFDPNRSFDTWVFRIASNLLIDQGRRRKHRQEISLDAPTASQEAEGRDKEGGGCPQLADPASDPQARMMAKEVNAELQSALHSLSPLHKATLLLVAQQRSYEQIADEFACPVGTVRSRVYRARLRVRRNLTGSAFLKESTLLKDRKERTSYE